MPEIGDIGLMRIHGATGLGIRIAQWLGGKGFADYEHSVICVSLDPTQNKAQVLEAEPGGARLTWYDDYVVMWCGFAYGLGPATQVSLVDWALTYVGTPYSFLDYAALVLHRFRLPVPFLKRYIADTRHMICSQMVDQVYQDCGIQLFADHRWPGYVTPGDLYQLERSRAHL